MPTTRRSRRRPAWIAQAAARDDSPTTSYAIAVGAGDILAGPWVRKACERHARDLVRGKKRGISFDPDAAARVFRFFEDFLRLAEGQFDGLPFRLEPWQQFIIGSLFGWKRRDGSRRFRTGYLEIGKGNGKTPMAAGIGLYGLLADAEASAEIYSAATARDQAKILYTDAERMVAASPQLASAVRRSVNNLAQVGGYSYFRPVSSEHKGLDGKRVHMALIDELHEHPTDLVIEKMRAGTKGRRQSLILSITNAGHNRGSVCWHHHDYSTRLLDSVNRRTGTADNDAWFAYVCALDEGDDPLTDEDVWIKANPNLGVSISHDYLRDQVREAVGMPTKQSIVKRLNFCEWTRTITRAIDLAAWDRCPRIVDSALVGRPCFGGLDLGQSDDFSAFALLWILDDGSYAIKVRYWLPEAARDRETTRDYEAWTDDAVLTWTPGSITDYDTIEDTVREACDQYGVGECAFDKRFAMQLAQHLTGHGLLMVDQPQGFQLSEATTRLQELVATKRLRHDGDPLLAWMAGNLVTRTGRYGEIRPDKDASGQNKIDGIVAVIMALARAIAQPEAASVYEDRGVLTI